LVRKVLGTKKQVFCTLHETKCIHMCYSKKRNSAPATGQSCATDLPPTQTAVRASTVNQYQAFNASDQYDPSTPPLYSSIYSGRSTTLIDNPLYDEHKPEAK